MLAIQATTIVCPHCGHHTHVDLDLSNGDQSYYDECTNCCNELHIVTHLDEVKSTVELTVDADNERIY